MMNWSSLLSPQRIGAKIKVDKSVIRSAFDRDYDRIIFSHPFRRLQDKTQVHPLPEHDFVHTRLTHSLEVSSVGRSLGKKVGETILQRCNGIAQFSSLDFGAIIAAASLAHDVGNPPFGHPGEKGISDFFSRHPQGKCFQGMVTEPQWNDLVHFEGNAQGFRILNKQQYQGLRLTYSTLGAFTKYPYSSSIEIKDNKKNSLTKYGFFQTEQSLFNEVATHLNLTKIDKNIWARHPLAFLVEAADDICYSIIDLEDGCRLGLVSFEDTIRLFSDILKSQFNKKKLDNINSQDEKIGALRALAINQLIDECAEIFLDNEDKILTNQFDSALVFHCNSAEALKEIKKISNEKIYHARHVTEIEVAGYTALTGLLQEFTLAGKHYIEKDLSGQQETLMRLLPLEVKSEIDAQSESTYNMLRSIIDFISGMTDNHVLSLYGKIKAYPMSGNKSTR